jgi:hypothetical protein
MNRKFLSAVRGVAVAGLVVGALIAAATSAAGGVHRWCLQVTAEDMAAPLAVQDGTAVASGKSIPSDESAATLHGPVNQTVRVGDTVAFEATLRKSEHDGLQWQWMPATEVNWRDLKDSGRVQGSRTPRLRLANVGARENGGRFRLIVGSTKHQTVFSESARLLVVPKRVTGDAGDVAQVLLTETNEAFKNPMKGFRPTRYFADASFKPHEYASVYKHYIRYTDLESSAADTAARIVEWSNREWTGIEKENVKVIPRVVIYYPNQGEFWPDGVPHSPPPWREENWTSKTLMLRLVAMILKLGEAWDGDPRVAAVELGLWGKWGELHIDPTVVSSVPPDPSGPSRIPPVFQKAMGDAALRAFANKKVLIRYPADTFADYRFGCYWDSFALPEDRASGEGEISKNVWRTQMNSGEVAFDWGTQSAVGGSPDGALSNTAVADYIDGWIVRTHTSSLGWIADYDAGNPAVRQNARSMQELMGYRFVVKEATFPRRIRRGSKLAVEFTVTNVGSAPFYYRWPVQAALLGKDCSVAWRGSFEADITSWVECRDYSVSGQFSVPDTVPNGVYVLALCVCDPAGMLPSLRFANANYYRGGWTPIGRVGLEEDVRDSILKPFDRLSDDRSLQYVVIGR